MATRTSLLVVLLLTPPTAVSAASAADEIRFDVRRAVECLDVTTDAFMAANPGERLVEARIEVSSLMRFGVSDRGMQLFVAMQSTNPDVQVLDYLPRTTLASQYAGNVGIERKTEKSANIGLNASFDYLVKGTVTSGLGNKKNDSLRYELVPPMETVLASGTLRRGTGVYFKLRSTPQTSLEGSHEFVLVLRVPEPWRADLLILQCQAVGPDQQPTGGDRFLISLYQAGDAEAKELADEFVRSEQELRQVAGQHERAIQDNAFPSMLHKVGRALSIVDPKIPEDWLDRLILAPVTTEVDGYSRLPRKVRVAAQSYARQRNAIVRLNGAATDIHLAESH